MTRAVLGQASSGADVFEIAQRYHKSNPNDSAGIGSLMRTASVAVAHHGDDESISRHARDGSAGGSSNGAVPGFEEFGVWW